METVPYLSICLNTLNLPLILQNPTNPFTKYMQGLSVIPAEMKLSNGYSLRQHLELLVEANPSQKYLLNKQGFSFIEVKSELQKFQKSSGYFDLSSEYKVVGTDFTRPHKYLTGPVEEPPKQPPPSTVPPLPETLVEPAREENTGTDEAQGQGRPTQIVEKRKLGGAPAKKKAVEDTRKAEATPQPKPPTAPVATSPASSGARPVQSPPQASALENLPTTRTPVLGQGQVRPTRVMGSLKVPEPIKNPVKNLGSQAAVQIIRHPLVKMRVLTSVLGAAGGYLVGGPGGAGAGAVMGGLFGPQIGSSILNYMTGGRSGDGDDDSGDSGDSGAEGGGGGRRGSGVGNRIRAAGRRMASQAARRAALAASRAAAGFLAANWWWILIAGVVGLILLIVLLMMLCILPLSSCSGNGGTSDITKQISIQKSGPLAVENGADIDYKIVVTNKGSAPANVTVTDDIPADTKYVSGDNDAVQDSANVTKIQWDVKSLAAGQSKTLTFKVTPQKTDTWIINQAKGLISGSIAYGNAVGLLPTPLSSEIGNWAATKDSIIAAVNKYPEVVAAYQKAASLTGVPWEVLAGLHFVETGSNPRPSASLVSGREIGAREPDIPASACAAGVSGPGTPIPMGGGCGFSSFEDSAIYSAKHIMGKIGDKVPSTFEDAVTALSRYNGGGNHNCGRGVPYNFCPRDFEGEDDPYSMNYFDQKHSEMYLIYCADGVQCSPPRPFGRPGAMAVIRALLGK